MQTLVFIWESHNGRVEMSRRHNSADQGSNPADFVSLATTYVKKIPSGTSERSFLFFWRICLWIAQWLSELLWSSLSTPVPQTGLKCFGTWFSAKLVPKSWTLNQSLSHMGSYHCISEALKVGLLFVSAAMPAAAAALGAVCFLCSSGVRHPPLGHQQLSSIGWTVSPHLCYSHLLDCALSQPLNGHNLFAIVAASC